MAPAHTEVYATTAAHKNLNAFAFTVVADVIFTANDGVTGFSGVTFPAGMTVYANMNNITLASGTIVVYFASVKNA